MNFFYRILALFNCEALLSTGIYFHLIPKNLGFGFLAGCLMFTICLPTKNRQAAGFAFYIFLLAFALTLHSFWTAVGFFLSPFVVGGMYSLILTIVRHDSETK